MRDGKRRADGPAVKRGPKRAPRTGKQKAWRVVRWLLAIGLVGALLVGAAFVVLYQTIDIPDPNKDFETQTTFVYFDDGKTELGRFATQNRVSIDLDQVPQSLKDAVVAAENETFWTDSGIDPKGIVRAAFNNAQGGSRQGASTITQQYVKILYLSQERSYQRKIKEAILSLKVQRQQSKSRILEGYLNTIYFGRGAYGVEAAARAFFDRPAKNLDLRQSAVLASVLNNPSRFDPANGKDAREALLGRYQYTLGQMADLDMISEEKAEKAKRRLPKFPKIEAGSTYGDQKGHMLTMVRKELARLGFDDGEIDGGGLRVTTTFTPKAMAAAKQAVLEERPEGFADKQLHVGVASVEPGTGAVRGFYGGQDYLQSQINWAVAGGQAGSTLKAFALAAAIKEGFSLNDTFDGNSPFELPGGIEVTNQGDVSYGSAISMITATQKSANSAFVDMTMAMDDGPRKVVKMMNAMGIPPADPRSDTPGFPNSSPGLEPVATVALGSATVSPINMASGYATIANEGVYHEPFIIEKVVDRSGTTRYSHDEEAPGPKRVLDADIAADVSYALQQNVTGGSGTAALALGRPAAGKTGTATNGRDEVSSAWFAGYTPQMATAVMYVRGKGNEQLQGWLPEYFGGSYPARTWTNVMQTLMEGLPVEEFPEPAYVDGDAPTDGHAPYVPPPSPTRKPPPSNQPSQSIEPETQEPTPTQTPTQEPTPTTEPEPSCDILGCEPTGEPPAPSSPPPSPEPTGSPTPGAGPSRPVGPRGRD